METRVMRCWSSLGKYGSSKGFARSWRSQTSGTCLRRGKAKITCVSKNCTRSERLGKMREEKEPRLRSRSLVLRGGPPSVELSSLRSTFLGLHAKQYLVKHASHSSLLDAPFRATCESTSAHPKHFAHPISIFCVAIANELLKNPS